VSPLSKQINDAHRQFGIDVVNISRVEMLAREAPRRRKLGGRRILRLRFRVGSLGASFQARCQALVPPHAETVGGKRGPGRLARLRFRMQRNGPASHAEEMNVRGIVVALALAAALSLPAHAQFPADYPSSYADLVAAGRKEGAVVVYSSTERAAAAPLIRDFEALYPGLKVDYRLMRSSEINRRFVAETAAGSPSADVLWSPAMDLQIKLSNDGYAAAYRSPEAKSLPEWAVWKDEAFATTYEPAVFAYNKRLLAASEVPQTHAQLARLLASDAKRFTGKIATYDIDKAAVGFLFVTQDSRTYPGFWTLARALGGARVRSSATTVEMLERIASGQDLIGYNVVGSYALTRAKRDPALGVVLPKDYTLVMSRVAIIAKKAPHPNAARLWLDYLLSRRGQTVLAAKSELFALRSDVEGEFTAAALARELGGSLKPIGVGPGLLVYLDRAKRLEFMREWERATGT